jgi:alpha-L-fucosidase
MKSKQLTRRDWMIRTASAVAAGAAALPTLTAAQQPAAAPQTKPAPGSQLQQLAAPAGAQQPAAPAGPPTPQDLNREQRMKWWHEAQFGMFIHWGLYSQVGRHEWVFENEAIPMTEYTPLAQTFKPRPNAARQWARIARDTGMKYMVMTTKHHEGFCNFDTKLTDYNAMKQGPGRDLVREYVDAARAEGMRVGFYYSLMDWHHPDGANCMNDPAARDRFVAYTHGLIRELMTNYGKIDVLWYDVHWPLDVDAWQSVKMNEMVFGLQPDIIVNNRNGLPGDFSTPEQTITAATAGRAWETCMTLNDSWGYQRADDNWKSPKTVIRNLITCARDAGNYLLNVGPRPDGVVPEDSVHVLEQVGQWMHRNGDTVIGSDVCQPRTSNYASFTRKGNTLYMHVHFWPGDYVAISGLTVGVKSAKMHASGESVAFTQDKFRVKLTGLSEEAPDNPVTTIAIECDDVPMQNTLLVRENKPRDGV